MRSRTIAVQGISVTLDILTSLEWLDLDISPEMSSIEVACRTVAYAVADWNGQGRINPSVLVADRERHNIVAAINNTIALPTPPILEVVEAGEELLVIGEEFSAKLRHPTILELIDILDKHSGLLRSEQKIAAIAALAVEWDGDQITDEMALRSHLIADRDSHELISAIDKALEPFFQTPPITEVEEGPVDDGGGYERVEDGSGADGLGESITFDVS